jgi:hypothetical protein
MVLNRHRLVLRLLDSFLVLSDHRSPLIARGAKPWRDVFALGTQAAPAF